MSADLQTWEAWHGIHQKFEIEWWRKHLPGHPTSSDEASFRRFWSAAEAFIKPVGEILDIGCGPRPPFPGAVIEPLALEYQKLPDVKPEWWAGRRVFAQPAEQFVPGLTADTILCLNCIDHAVGWRDILTNMVRYARTPDAVVVVTTDFHAPFEGHPGFERTTFMKEIDARFVIVEQYKPLRHRLDLRLRVR